MGRVERARASFHPFRRASPYSLVKAMNICHEGDEPHKEREEQRHVERKRQQSDRGPLVHGILG